MRPSQSHAQTSSTDLVQLLDATPSRASATSSSTTSTSKSRSLQFSFPCTRATKSPSPKLEKACSARSVNVDLDGDADDSPVRARSNTIARHTKAKSRPLESSPRSPRSPYGPHATSTLPNPKTRKRSTTHPRAGSPPLTLQQVTDFLARATQGRGQDPGDPSTSSTRSKHRSKSNKPFTPGTASGIDSLLSSAALSYSAGYLQDYSQAPQAALAGSYSPPPADEYSPTELRPPHMYTALSSPPPKALGVAIGVACPSDYQEPIIDPPPLPPPNFQGHGLHGQEQGTQGLEPGVPGVPGAESPDFSSLEDSQQIPMLFADYLDFTSSSSKSRSHKSASPRTPDSGLHGADYSPDPLQAQDLDQLLRPPLSHQGGFHGGHHHLGRHGLHGGSSAVNLAHDLAHGLAHGVHVSGSSFDACGLCATLGQPWVDICRAIRASKTK